MWWLSYESKGSWQSNHAEEVEVKVLSETLNRDAYAREGEHDFSLLESYPIFAIDFVYSLARRQLMAIDFNSAPGLKHTGMDQILGAKACFDLIHEFVLMQQVKQNFPTTMDVSILSKAGES